MRIRRLELGLMFAIATLSPSCQSNDLTPSEGTSHATIVGGQPVSRNRLFATVGVFRAGSHRCSGVLIAPTVALTAAHCVARGPNIEDLEMTDPSRLEIAVGALDLDNLSSPEIDLHQVKAIHLPPDLDVASILRRDPHPTDLAILELSTPVTAIHPVPLFPQAQLGSLQGRDPLVIAGYGCRGEEGASGLLFEGETHQYLVEPEFLYISGLPRVCPGDSGGPAYVFVEDQPWVLGVASGEGSLSFFAVASQYEAWIRETTRGPSPQTPEPTETPEPAGTPGPAETPAVLDPVNEDNIPDNQPSTKSGSCDCAPWPHDSQPLRLVTLFLVLLSLPRLNGQPSTAKDDRHHKPRHSSAGSGDAKGA